ncbi:MAG: DUF975 family protein [Calditrichaeota bacterium]|nr:DUF975 family protein [Calditrichota bacterium]
MGKLSTTDSGVLTAQAREALRGNWGIAVVTTFVFSLILWLVTEIPDIGGLAAIVVTGPLLLGYDIFSLSVSRGQEAKTSLLFDGFKKFWTALGAYIIICVLVFLWSLLLIIPGIIAAIAYSQTFFIIADTEHITPMEAIRKSKSMMMGNKTDFTALCLRFLGWAVLCLFTLGIGFFWLGPYSSVALAKFYDDIAERPSEDSSPDAVVME